MSAAFLTPGWDFEGLEHGFAPRDTDIAPHLRVVRVKQVHGAELIVADGRTPPVAGDADGLFTACPGTAVAIATADCVPVLLAAPAARVVAAVHAGWRGSLAGIVPRAVATFRERFGVPPPEIRAALGPSIGGCCYEVERDIAEKFASRYGPSMWEAWTNGRTGKGTLDLRTVNERLLRHAGIPAEAITHVGPCTSCGNADLASYRVQGPKAGRQLSWIGLAA